MPELKFSISEGDVVAGNYRILGIAGSGGMGVIYRALDLRLERVVALKFLPPELNASESDRQRFLREARIASSLDHPNIGVIHGVEETAEGSAFIIMAFYEGVSLAELIRRGALPVHRAIDIASQMANGLADAHSHNIAHRDIKPSNVMLTASGQAKIVDFGLAHVVSASTASQVGISGTIAYMAPEQAMGEMADHRCDIWALGVVLAEMLTGANPFHRETIPAILLAVLNDPPANIDALHPALQPIIYRALSKDAKSRYASCAEFLADLERSRRLLPAELPEGADATATLPPGAIRTIRQSAEARRAREGASRSAFRPSAPRRFPWRALLIGVLVLVVAASVAWFVPSVRSRIAALMESASEQKHIAVLPFGSTGNNPENATLIDGLMDSLTGRLSNLDVGNKSLWVVPNSVVEREKVTDPTDALRALGANLVVKGSVERDGNDIRLTTNLIDTKQLRQIGSVQVEDPTGDLSTLEDETVARLARLMNISVTANMLHNTGGRVDPAAYEDYLKALGLMQRFDKPGNLDSAIGVLQQSTQTDPQFALGYAAMGEAYRLKYQVDQNVRWLSEAQANCQKAVELDNSISAVFVTLGRIHDALGKHDLAMTEFRHALELDPKGAAALEGEASSYESAGRIADAEKAYQKAAAMRPDDWYGYNDLGRFYDQQGKYPQAVAAYQQALDLTPDNSELYSNLAAAYLDAGGTQNLVKAEAALKRSVALDPTYPAYANLGLLYLQGRRYVEAAAATEKALQINGNDYRVWINLMTAYEGAGKDNKAEVARKRAEQATEHLVALKPQDAEAQSTLAALYAHDKLNDKALSKIRTALALAPKDAGVLSGVGSAYEFMGNRAKALQYIEKAISDGYALDEVTNDPDLQALVADPRFKAKFK